ncbi:metallophosphoesterase family protein [Rhodopirellula sp. MGV]|uniref:metallophosphoesterase family protein n=1 Tax=Rhodopirellula sp. MGV TaxID=2023130 RepID=UPI000B96D476|nr:metallophosphoesterase family protein [Rhodopirellula sp. MGV]OYP32345.1 serine/threonine protein phosphatase [Rhodopirellula sp. MGV]PNY35872.1 serine/threonine protein phosphatase [Rhodopirellula baltica]
MSGRLIAIGDIHGCRLALERLIEAIQPRENDTIVTLGDYIDRGPDSCGVLDTLIQLAQRTRLVGILGNHEEMMLEVLNHGAAHHAWLRYGGVETLESYNFNGDLDFLPDTHKEFLDSLGDYYAQGDFFFTHAAYDPEAEFENQEIEMLRWYSLTDGIPPRHLSGKTAVVGHTANRDGEVLDAGHLVCIDTYCYGGGWLTAMEMNTRQVWQTDRQGRLKETAT